MGTPEQDLGLRKGEDQVGIPQVQMSKPHFSSLSPFPNIKLPTEEEPIPKKLNLKCRSCTSGSEI